MKEAAGTHLAGHLGAERGRLPTSYDLLEEPLLRLREHELLQQYGTTPRPALDFFLDIPLKGGPGLLEQGLVDRGDGCSGTGRWRPTPLMQPSREGIRERVVAGGERPNGWEVFFLCFESEVEVRFGGSGGKKEKHRFTDKRNMVG
jgi:hypothetical protein